MAVNLVTRDTARVFFGRDIECAQCHDHPLISDYEQSEYYGLLAFLDRSYIFQPDKKKPAVIAEKAEGVVKFKSVFTGYEGETRPRLPGEREITEPTFKKGEEYKVKPAKNVRPVPKYSRREKFAELATAGTNEVLQQEHRQPVMGRDDGPGSGQSRSICTTPKTRPPRRSCWICSPSSSWR